MHARKIIDKSILNESKAELKDSFKEKILVYSQTGEEKLYNELITRVKATLSLTEAENLIKSFNEAKQALYNQDQEKLMNKTIGCGVTGFCLVALPGICFWGVQEGLKTGLAIGAMGAVGGMRAHFEEGSYRYLNSALRIIDNNLATLAHTLEINKRKHSSKERRDHDKSSAPTTFGLRCRA